MRPKAVGLCPAEFDAINSQPIQKLRTNTPAPADALYRKSHRDAQLHKLAAACDRIRPRRTSGREEGLTL